MFNLAENWRLRPRFTNPCRCVKKYKEKKRDRFLSREELRRLGEALRIEEEFAPQTFACIRHLLLSKWLTKYPKVLPHTFNGKMPPIVQPDATRRVIKRSLREVEQIWQVARRMEYALPRQSPRNDCLVQGVQTIQRVLLGLNHHDRRRQTALERGRQS